MVETTTVDEVAAEFAVPDVQGLVLGAPGVRCERNAEAVGKLVLKGVPVGEGANKLGLRLVPLLCHSGETLVEVVQPHILCDMGMLAVTNETVDKFLYEGTYLEDIFAFAVECGYDGLGAPSFHPMLLRGLLGPPCHRSPRRRRLRHRLQPLRSSCLLPRLGVAVFY